MSAEEPSAEAAAVAAATAAASMAAEGGAAAPSAAPAAAPPLEEDPGPRGTVLVVGGFGYVAQFVIEALLARGGFRIHATHRLGRETRGLPEAVRLHALDFADSDSVAAVLAEVAPSVVVNCAAMSMLGACQSDPAAAMVANCPRYLVEVLAAQAADAPRLLIHFSTDIVFDGDPSKIYDEETPPAPVNAYGQSKAAFDALLAETARPTSVVLRPTNIVGPVHPYVAGAKPKFLQWLDGRLRADEPTKLFQDEYRNYVWVEDLVAVVMKLIEDFPARPPPHNLFHCGGPEALNRVDVACALAEAKGYALTYRGADGAELPRIVPAMRADVDLGYPSPLCVRFASPRLGPFLGRPARSVRECIVASASRI